MEGDSMSQEWNPLATVDPVTIPLEVAGTNDDGSPRASIVCKPWGGRERLAYEDAITERLLTTDTRGEETVKIGALRLYAVSLTLIGASGFPERNGRPMFTGSREDREEDLLALDPATYDEIRRHALRVQPLPKAGDDSENAAEVGGGEDPSRTPSTPPEGAPAGE